MASFIQFEQCHVKSKLLTTCMSKENCWECQGPAFFPLSYRWLPCMYVFLQIISLCLKITNTCMHVYTLYHKAVNCGPLSNPENGIVDTSAGTSIGKRATYSCNTGYRLNGPMTRSCNSFGLWDPTAPSCYRKCSDKVWENICSHFDIYTELQACACMWQSIV